MSRQQGRLIDVKADAEGNPVAFSLPDGSAMQTVVAYLSYWREWIGVLDGEPERDVWCVETTHGICEIHCLRSPLGTEDSPETWLLHAWED